ncbi:MAG: efflux RND transporter periplasmic adaptor subunit [Ignavibacteriales bacterium]|nr:efflux RND transporter periplasmic adaptor subunit [Ignavibacteriales bacterium]
MKYFITLFLTLFLFGCSKNDKNAITASGTIETTEVTVTAKVGGEITKLHVNEGANVNKGDTLVTIDKTDFEIQYKQSSANAAAAEAQYKLTILGPRDEDVLQAKANFENAQSDFQRAEKLLKQKTVTQKQYDDTKMKFIMAQQNYGKMKSGSRKEEVDIARARRDQAVAQVDAARKKLNDTYVTATMKGVITEKAIEEGDIVMPNGSLLRISRLDKVYIMIYVTEVELARVKLGHEAKIYIDAYPNKSFTGKVSYISDVAEFTPKNVQTKEDRTKLVFGVKIEVENPEQQLKPGMPADATIEIGSK